ncbi:protein of unknown function [Saccharopolyspora antimicrobica]|uniref:Uncharacterized protein DUF4352 n=1 Tax=Saccharopolyspora antimicrobica TaxID=455193 RepID=A0A1I4WXX1_9PSEU|nr:DUF4352 domain-containing protein [Saccharopolyspora antimicrobica]RKT84197.1 uncharacterized protein DUF4352 [Saccharopolyspora antimicrobica]SFN18275.1 protein of unknown function [Saccharopolyspora antimicrobica]
MKKLLAPTVGLLLLGLAGCGAANEATAPEPKSQTAPEQAETEAATIEVGGKDVAFGETAGVTNEEGGQYAITASALQDVAEFSVPPVEGKYVSTDVEASLISGTGGAVASVGFMLVDAAGNEYVSAAPNGENMDGVLFATLLTQGDSGSGKVYFDVPADATGLKLVFQPLTATEPIGSWS